MRKIFYTISGLVLGFVAVVTVTSIREDLSQTAHAQISDTCIEILGESAEVLVSGVPNAGQFLFEGVGFPVDASKACINTEPEEVGDLKKYPLTGWVWNSNIGWISLGCEGGSNGGKDCGDTDYTSYLEVEGSNPETALLTGFWWGAEIGWISLSCPNSEWEGCGANDYGAVELDVESRVDEYITVDEQYAWNDAVGWMSLKDIKMPFTDEMAGGDIEVTITITPDPADVLALRQAEADDPSLTDAELDDLIANPNWVTSSGADADTYEVVVTITDGGVLIEDDADYFIDVIGSWCNTIRNDQIEGEIGGDCDSGTQLAKLPIRVGNGFEFEAGKGYVGKATTKVPTNETDVLTLENVAVYVEDNNTGDVLYEETLDQDIDFEFVPAIDLHSVRASQDGGETWTDDITADPDQDTTFEVRFARYRSQNGDPLPANNLVTIEMDLDVKGGYKYIFDDYGDEDDGTLSTRTLDTFLGADEEHKKYNVIAHLEEEGIVPVNEKFDSVISYSVGVQDVKYLSRKLRSVNEDAQVDLTAKVTGSTQLNALFEIDQDKIARPVGQRVEANRDEFYKNLRLIMRGIEPRSILDFGSADMASDTFGTVRDKPIRYYSRASQGTRDDRVLWVGAETSRPIDSPRTLLVEGGNVVITDNIISGEDGQLGIIVMKDQEGRGGNIYIHPDVTDIHANIFADGTIFSYSGRVADIDADGIPVIADPETTLTNQLTIVGAVNSNNTYGGSEQDPMILGDGSTTADENEARLYDLNWLRYSPLKVEINEDGEVVRVDDDGEEIGTVLLEDADLTKSREAGGDLVWPEEVGVENLSSTTFGSAAKAKKHFPVNIIYSPPVDGLPGF